MDRGMTAVVMETDDGPNEQVFATRFQAELFIAYIPIMAAISEEFAAIRSAILSPVRKEETWHEKERYAN